MPNPDATLDLEWLYDYPAGNEDNVYRAALKEFDRKLITLALARCLWNQSRAAKSLGLSRFTLRAKMKSLGLSIKQVLAELPKEP